MKIKNFILLIAIGLLCSSFSNTPKENEITLRNIEALSRGEETSSKCVEAEGKCIVNGIVLFGMTPKN